MRVLCCFLTCQCASVSQQRTHSLVETSIFQIGQKDFGSPPSPPSHSHIMTSSATAATALIQRLVEQMELKQARDDELLLQTRQLAQQEAERLTMADKAAAASELVDDLNEQKDKLNAELEAVRNEYLKHIAEDERKRKELSEELGGEITAVNDRIQKETSLRAAAMEENSQLKAKIGILKESATGIGAAKFTEMLTARDGEVKKVQDRLGSEAETEKVLQQKLSAQESILAQTQITLDELKAKVHDYTEKFGQVKRVLEANAKKHEAARQEHDRGMKRIRAMESELKDAATRLARSQAEYDVEATNTEKLESQLKALENASAKLQSLAAVLSASFGQKHEDPAKSS